MSHHVLKRESALQAACHSTCTVCGVYTQKTATQSMSYTGAVDALLVTLEPDTDYYFRAKAVGDGTGYGEEQSFTTHGSAPAPDLVPSIAGVQWTDPWNPLVPGALGHHQPGYDGLCCQHGTAGHRWDC